MISDFLYYLVKIPNSEFNGGGQKRDRLESSAAEVPAPKSQKKSQSQIVSSRAVSQIVSYRYKDLNI